MGSPSTWAKLKPAPKWSPAPVDSRGRAVKGPSNQALPPSRSAAPAPSRGWMTMHASPDRSRIRSAAIRTPSPSDDASAYASTPSTRATRSLSARFSPSVTGASPSIRRSAPRADSRSPSVRLAGSDRSMNTRLPLSVPSGRGTPGPDSRPPCSPIAGSTWSISPSQIPCTPPHSVQFTIPISRLRSHLARSPSSPTRSISRPQVTACTGAVLPSMILPSSNSSASVWAGAASGTTSSHLAANGP